MESHSENDEPSLQTVENYDFVKIILTHIDKKFDGLRQEMRMHFGSNNIKHVNRPGNEEKIYIFNRLPVKSVEELTKLELDIKTSTVVFDELVSTY